MKWDKQEANSKIIDINLTIDKFMEYKYFN